MFSHSKKRCFSDGFCPSGQPSATTYPRCFVCCFCICFASHDLRVSAQSFRELIFSPTSPVLRGASGQLERSGLNRPRHPRKTARQHPPISLRLPNSFPLFFPRFEEKFKSSFPCVLFCVLFLFDENHATLHNKSSRFLTTKKLRHDRITHIHDVRFFSPRLARQPPTKPNNNDVRPYGGFCFPFFTPYSMEHLPTTIRHDVDSKMVTPIVITKPKWFQFWKQPVLVNMQLIARQVDLTNDWNRLTEQRHKLFEDLNRFQKQTAQFKKQDGKWRTLFQTIEWASQPTQKNKPRRLPGMKLELSLLALHMMVGIAFMMV